MLQSFPESATIYKNLAQLYTHSNQEKAIELFNKSLQYEKDPTIYINLISTYVSKNDYEGARECFKQLEENCSDKPQIKQKIDILREKLNHILTASAS